MSRDLQVSKAGNMGALRSVLHVTNRQRVLPADGRLVRRVARALLKDLLGRSQFDLGVYLVGETEMRGLNERFLQHKGSTDVITFDYTDPAQPEFLRAEIFICADEALTQARRFRTTWQSELVRYLVHGVLHLNGYDDRQSAEWRKMKREEDRLLRELQYRALHSSPENCGAQTSARNPRSPVGPGSPGSA